MGLGQLQGFGAANRKVLALWTSDARCVVLDSAYDQRSPCGSPMRTTLTIDDDILALARARAEAEGRSIGDVISELARRGLTPTTAAPQYRNGIRLIPAGAGAGVATLEIVNQLRDESP